jgi:hypothetical protein
VATTTVPVPSETGRHPAFQTLTTAWHAAAQRRRLTTYAGLTLLLCLVFALLTLALQFVSAVVLAIWIGLVAVAWRPRVGLLVSFGMVMFFENGGADAVMLPGYYFYAGLGSHLGLGGILPSPVEVLLGLTVIIWLAEGLMRHRLDFRAGTLKWPMLAFVIALLVGLARGFIGRAPLNFILWEFRFLVYFVACYYLATNTIRSKRDVRAIVILSLVVMTLFGLEGTYRKLALVDTGVIGVPMEFAFSHESVIFWGVLVLLVTAQFVFGAPAWQRMIGAIGLPIATFALMASERRSGQIGLIMGFIAMSLVFFIAKRKAFYYLSLPLALAFMVYLPLFWNNTSTLGQPARAIRSLREPDPRDFYSNLYREMEKVNIYATIRANPILGVGFGRPFLIVIQLVDVSWWPLWMHQPHNNIMWIWLKLGPAGYIVFWTLMGAALARTAFLTRTLKNREAKIFSLYTLGGMVATLVFCYVDLAFTGPRANVFLGTLIGTLAVLDQIYD